MASDIFLEFAGNVLGVNGESKVVGESTDARHQNMVAVNAFAFSVENKQTVGSATSGAGAGKAVFNSLTISKPVDAASPALFATLGSGGHFPQLNLYIRKAGAASGDYLVYRFKLALVTKITWTDSSGDDQPEEEVEFQYGALQVQYAQQSPNGQLAAPKQQAWSQVTNKADFVVPGVPNAP
jgi:type VI secretion system secreted protein Hcp